MRLLLRGLLLCALCALLLLLLPREDGGRAKRGARPAEVEPGTRGSAPSGSDSFALGDPRPETEFFTALQGTVVDESGAPVPDAEVYALPRNSYLVPAAEIRTHCVPVTSDERGRFLLQGAFTQDREIVCRKAGYVPARIDAATAKDELEIVLVRGGRMHGRVSDPLGVGIPGVDVRARADSVHCMADRAGDFPAGDAMYLARARTDENGYFEIRGLREDVRYLVEAHATGYVMTSLRWRDRRLWRRPGEEPIDIRMQSLVVAVIGARVGDVDCTLSARVPLLTTHRVVPPAGYELAFKGVPVDRFPARIVARLRRLEKDHVVVTAKATEDIVGAGTVPLSGKARLGLLGLPETEFSVAFRPVGSKGWDRVQWLEFAGTLSLGRVTVVEKGASASSGKDIFELYLISKNWGRSGMPKVWRLLPAVEPGAWTAKVTPGEYLVMMQGGQQPIAGAGYEVDVKPRQDVRIETAFGTIPLLRIRPRYPSGAQVHEVGISLRRARAEGKNAIRQLWSLPEPNGCVDGTELIPITEWQHGEVEITITKQGFQRVQAHLNLTDSDVAFSPVLKRRAPR